MPSASACSRESQLTSGCCRGHWFAGEARTRSCTLWAPASDGSTMGEESARIMHLERKRTARGSVEFNQSTVMSCCSEETESTCSTTDEDKDQELEYGPGIVNKLRTRFLSITLKQSNGPRSNMRRSCSLENLLDKDRTFQENVFLVQERWIAGDGGLKSRNVSCWSKMKRAKSMDTLLLEADAEQGEVHLEQECELDAAKNEVASADVATDGKLLHEPKVIKRRDGGLCRSTVAICDEELPKPDTVKTYKRIFEPVEAKLVAHSNVRRRPPVLRASAKVTTGKPGNGAVGLTQIKRNGLPAKSRFSAKDSSKAGKAGGDVVCQDPNPPEDGEHTGGNNRLHSVAEDVKISRLVKEKSFVGRLGKDDNEKNDVKKNETVMQYNLLNAKFSGKSKNCVTTGKAISIKECKKKFSLISDLSCEEDAGVENVNGVQSNGERETIETSASNKNESDAKETNCRLGDEDGECRSSELLKNQTDEEKPAQNGFCPPKCDERNGAEGENGDSPSNQRAQLSEEKTTQWQKPSSSNTIVFDFRGKDVTPHLSLMPTPFGCKAAVQPRKRRTLMMDGKEMAPFANGLVNGNSSHGDSDDEDYESGDNLPHPSGVLFEGENVRVGRGAILTTRDKRLKIQFDDAIVNTFEYPSEASLLEECQSGSSSLTGSDSDLSSVDSPPPLGPRLQANTPIGFSGGLAAYTPRVLQAVDAFEPGMFRPLQKETADEEASVTSSSHEENGAEEEEMLKPADPEDSSAWSDATNTSDLLF